MITHLIFPKQAEKSTGNQGVYTAQKEETPTMMFPLSDQKQVPSDFESLQFKSINTEGHSLEAPTSYWSVPHYNTTPVYEKRPKLILSSMSGYERTISATAEIKVNRSMFSFDYKIISTGILHLFLPRYFDPGINQEGHRNRSELLQEKHSIIASKEPTGFNFAKANIVSLSSVQYVIIVLNSDIMHLLLSLSFDPGIRQADGETNQGQKLKQRPPSCQICPKKNIILHHAEAPKVNSAIIHSVHKTKVSGMIHLVFVQNVENFSGCKEESFKLKPYQGANRDICALKMPYLLNQEDFHYETNGNGNLTHQGLKPNWNHAQSFSDEKVMNSTSRVILCLLCLNFAKFRTSQFYLWRPGEHAKVMNHVFKDSFITDYTDMMHLFLSKAPCADFKKTWKRTRRNYKHEEDKRFNPLDLDQCMHQDVPEFIPIKEEPPDVAYMPAPSINKLGKSELVNHNAHSIDLQGKYTIFEMFNVTDLSLFVAGSDLRTNPFQEGEDDVILTSLEAEPEIKHSLLWKSSSQRKLKLTCSTFLSSSLKNHAILTE